MNTVNHVSETSDKQGPVLLWEEVLRGLKHLAETHGPVSKWSSVNPQDVASEPAFYALRAASRSAKRLKLNTSTEHDDVALGKIAADMLQPKIRLSDFTEALKDRKDWRQAHAPQAVPGQTAAAGVKNGQV